MWVKRYTLADAVKDTGGRLLGRFDDVSIEIPYIEQNTERLKGGSMFLPYKGRNVDGHEFIEDALRMGCIGCLTEKELPSYMDDKFYILVDDVVDAEWKIIASKLGDRSTKVICVTGSVGKTTTTGMIANVLRRKYSVFQTVGNKNDEYLGGEIAFQISDDFQYAVIEMGMGMESSVINMAKAIRPEMIVFTNIGYAHIEKTGSLEATRDEKCGTEKWLADHGLAVVNCDDPLLMSYEYTHQVVKYGREKGDWKFLDHVVYPQRAAFTVGRICGLDDTEICEGIMSFKNETGRMDVIHLERMTLIDSSFNASVASVNNALDYLGAFPMTRIAVIGDMLEVGSYAEHVHNLVGRHVSKENTDVLIAVGSHGTDVIHGVFDKDVEKHLAPDLSTAEEILRSVIERCSDGPPTVLIKGSHGSGVYMIAEKIRRGDFWNGKED